VSEAEPPERKDVAGGGMPSKEGEGGSDGAVETTANANASAAVAVAAAAAAVAAKQIVFKADVAQLRAEVYYTT
jgi:hypothetical protein